MSQSYIKNIQKLYESGLSCREIAEQVGYSSKKVYNDLKKNGTKMRTKKEATQNALKMGKMEHPTKGKKLSDETKAKIGQSQYEVWNNRTPEELEQISEGCKERWDNMSDEFKEEFQEKSRKAISASSREGSKLEKALYEKLSEAGYDVAFHAKPLPQENLECDLILPNEKIAIELDGPMHFANIYGEDVQQKRQQADDTKNGFLIKAGICVVRVQYATKQISNAFINDVFTRLVEFVESTKKKFPAMKDRIVYFDYIRTQK